MFNSAFLRPLLVFALAIGLLQLLLAFSPLPTMSWALLFEGFCVGALVLHKRLSAVTWLNATTDRPLRLFVKTFFVYVAPAGILWSLFVVGVFQDYLPRVGLILMPGWATLSVTIGVLALCAALVGNELSQLRRPPR